MCPPLCIIQEDVEYAIGQLDASFKQMQQTAEVIGGTVERTVAISDQAFDEVKGQTEEKEDGMLTESGNVRNLKESPNSYNKDEEHDDDDDDDEDSTIDYYDIHDNHNNAEAPLSVGFQSFDEFATRKPEIVAHPSKDD